MHLNPVLQELDIRFVGDQMFIEPYKNLLHVTTGLDIGG